MCVCKLAWPDRFFLERENTLEYRWVNHCLDKICIRTRLLLTYEDYLKASLKNQTSGNLHFGAVSLETSCSKTSHVNRKIIKSPDSPSCLSMLWPTNPLLLSCQRAASNFLVYLMEILLIVDYKSRKPSVINNWKYLIPQKVLKNQPCKFMLGILANWKLSCRAAILLSTDM